MAGGGAGRASVAVEFVMKDVSVVAVVSKLCDGLGEGGAASCSARDCSQNWVRASGSSPALKLVVASPGNTSAVVKKWERLQ